MTGGGGGGGGGGRGGAGLSVVLVSREFPPAFGGGIGTYAWNAARGLARAGCRVRVLTGAEGAEPGEKEEAPGVLVRRLPSGEHGGGWAGRSAGFSLAAAREIASLVRTAEVDVVEFAECEGAGAAWLGLRATASDEALRRVASIVHFHTPTEVLVALGSGVRQELDQELSSVVLMERAAIALADGWCAPSRFIAEWACDWFALPETPRVIAYPLGDPASRVAQSTSEQRVLYVGRLEARKGVESLCAAWEDVVREHSGGMLRMVGADTRTAPGGGSMREHLISRLSETARRSVIFVDACRADELARHYAWASVCVVPSLWENFPNTCMEAMSHGRCVVVGDRGGMVEMIGDTRAGVAFRAGDAAGLARTLGGMLDESAWSRLERGLIARRRIGALCDPERVALERIAFYREAIGRARVGGRSMPRDGAASWWRDAEAVAAGNRGALRVPEIFSAGT